MNKREVANILALAAKTIEQDPRTTVTSGIVMASGLSRLLDRLKEPGFEPYNGRKDTRIGDYGYPERHAPDDKSPGQLKLDRMRPFGVISAFKDEIDGRRISRAENLQRSRRILMYMNNLWNIYSTHGEKMGPGVYKLLGHWAEPNNEANDRGLTYKEAIDQGLVGESKPEESYLIIKHPNEYNETFESTLVMLGGWMRQDGVIFHDGDTVWMIAPKTGNKEKIGTGLVAPLMGKAYSRMRNKRNIPFVFAGTQQPTSGIEARMMYEAGLRYVGGIGESGPEYHSTLMGKGTKL